MHYVYCSAAGKISLFSIDEPQVFFRNGREYLQFFDEASGRYKTPRLDRVLFSSDSDEEAQAALVQFQKDTPAPAARPSKSNHIDAFQVCFTGFSAGDKARLVAAAVECGMRVRSSVTTGLDLLVTGSNAGPAKLLKAHNQGVSITYEAGFLHLLQTGELLDEV